MSDNGHEIKEKLVARQAAQYEEINGKPPDAKVTRKMEQAAAASVQRVMNRERVWTPQRK